MSLLRKASLLALLALLVVLSDRSAASQCNLMLLGAGTCAASGPGTIAFGSVGAASAGTTSVSLAYPASIAAGDLLVVCLANKYPPNGPEATPSGFAIPANGQGSGGSGSSGIDTGNVYSTVYVKEADGTETGNLSITITSGNSAIGAIARYTKSAGTWSYAATNGSENTASDPWTVTGAADPGVQSGDRVLVCSARNANYGFIPTITLSQSGVTYGAATERLDIDTTQGDDSAVGLSDQAVTAGTSSGVPSFSAAVSPAPGADAPAGASVILRLRAQ